LADPHFGAFEQASLREKTKQLKALASELNMYQAQVRAGAACVACVLHLR
jgi:hypothetical protein